MLTMSFTARQKTDGIWVGQNLYLHGSSNLKDKETVSFSFEDSQTIQTSLI